jgi:hypothetical protein
MLASTHYINVFTHYLESLSLIRGVKINHQPPKPEQDVVFWLFNTHDQGGEIEKI